MPPDPRCATGVMTRGERIAEFFFIAGVDEHALESFVHSWAADSEPQSGSRPIRKVTLEEESEDGGITIVADNTLRTVNPAQLRKDKKKGRHAKRLSNYDSVIPPLTPISWPAHTHPLDRKLDPVLLDMYPRAKLPDYVPMFAFPDDVQIQCADSEPSSTHHHFVMTNEHGSRSYGTCVTVWLPLSHHIAALAERQSEKWHSTHLEPADVELAVDLNRRLASHRARLAQLLTDLSTATDVQSREEITNEIAGTEENIGITMDIIQKLDPRVRHSITGGKSSMWIPRVYGLLSRDASTLEFRLEWLRVLLSDDQSVPMERLVKQLLCAPILEPGCQLRFNLDSVTLFARRHAKNELPLSRDTDLYGLFRCLSVRSIIELLEAVLSESRIIFLSSSLAMLASAARAIVSLMYPLEWQSLLIPVLPTRLIACLEMPVPYIIGLHRTGSKVTLPEDDYVLCDLDGDAIVSSSTPPLLPASVRNKLFSLLELSAPLHRYPYSVAHGTPRYISETYPEDTHVLPFPDLMAEVPAQQGLHRFVGQSSATYQSHDPDYEVHAPVLNLNVGAIKYKKSRRRSMFRKSVKESDDSAFLFDQGSVVVEGHILTPTDADALCAVCRDSSQLVCCRNCGLTVHKHCPVVLPCIPAVFHPTRTRAAFVRAMATIFFNYRRFLVANRFNRNAFLSAMPKDRMPYSSFLLNTQCGAEFVRAVEAGVRFDVFDGVVESRRKRGIKGKLRPGTGPVYELAEEAEFLTIDVTMAATVHEYVRFPARLDALL